MLGGRASIRVRPPQAPQDHADPPGEDRRTDVTACNASGADARSATASHAVTSVPSIGSAPSERRENHRVQPRSGPCLRRLERFRPDARPAQRARGHRLGHLRGRAALEPGGGERAGAPQPCRDVHDPDELLRHGRRRAGHAVVDRGRERDRLPGPVPRRHERSVHRLRRCHRWHGHERGRLGPHQRHGVQLPADRLQRWGHQPTERSRRPHPGADPTGRAAEPRGLPGRVRGAARHLGPADERWSGRRLRGRVPRGNLRFVPPRRHHERLRPHPDGTDQRHVLRGPGPCAQRRREQRLHHRRDGDAARAGRRDGRIPRTAAARRRCRHPSLLARRPHRPPRGEQLRLHLRVEERCGGQRRQLHRRDVRHGRGDLHARRRGVERHLHRAQDERGGHVHLVVHLLDDVGHLFTRRDLPDRQLRRGLADIRRQRQCHAARRRRRVRGSRQRGVPDDTLRRCPEPAGRRQRDRPLRPR